MHTRHGAVHGGAQPSLLVMALAAAAVIGLGSTAWLLMRDSGGNGGAEEAPRAAAFDASDFKWPELMEQLYKGTATGAVNTDEAVFILYYLKEMNEVFGDPDMKVFIDPVCFTRVFDAEMSARLKSMFWTKVVPQAVLELGGVLTTDRPVAQVLSERYPILAGVLRDLAKEVPGGQLDRIFILANLPHILQAKARQDAITLFSHYQCKSDVTRRIYANAVTFVKTYGARASS
jgi:hypothetical protein